MAQSAVGCCFPGCKNMARLYCSQCHTTTYCSDKCQRMHWPAHRKICCATVGIRVPDEDTYDALVMPVAMNDRLHVMGKHWDDYPNLRVFKIRYEDWVPLAKNNVTLVETSPLFFPYPETVIIFMPKNLEIAPRIMEHFFDGKQSVKELMAEAEKDIPISMSVEGETLEYKRREWLIDNKACWCCYRSVRDKDVHHVHALPNMQTSLCNFCEHLYESHGRVLPTKADYDSEKHHTPTRLVIPYKSPFSPSRIEISADSPTTPSSEKGIVLAPYQAPSSPLSELAGILAQPFNIPEGSQIKSAYNLPKIACEIVNASWIERFRCVKCEARMIEYALLVCGHGICSTCLEILSKNKELFKCPLCEKPVQWMNTKDGVRICAIPSHSEIQDMKDLMPPKP